MSIRVSCPTFGCGLVLEVPDRHAGTTLRCPLCATAIPVPAADGPAVLDGLPPLLPELPDPPPATVSAVASAAESQPADSPDFLLSKDEPNLLPLEPPPRSPWDDEPAADAAAASGDPLVVLSLDEPQPEPPAPSQADVPRPFELSLEEVSAGPSVQALPAAVPEAPTPPVAAPAGAYAPAPLPAADVPEVLPALPEAEGYSLLDDLGEKAGADDVPMPVDGPAPAPSASPWDDSLDRGRPECGPTATERPPKPRRKGRTGGDWRTALIGLTALAVGAVLTILVVVLVVFIRAVVGGEAGATDARVIAPVFMVLILGLARGSAFAAGYVCCLYIPARVNTRRLVVAALALTGLSLFFGSGDTVVALVNGPGRFGYGAASVIGVAGRLTTVAEILVGVFFLRALARGIRETDLGASAGRLVTFTLIGIALDTFLLLFRAATSPDTTPGIIRVAFGWTAVIVVLTDLVWYTGLVWALRSAIRQSLDDG